MLTLIEEDLLLWRHLLKFIVFFNILERAIHIKVATVFEWINIRFNFILNGLKSLGCLVVQREISLSETWSPLCWRTSCLQWVPLVTVGIQDFVNLQLIILQHRYLLRPRLFSINCSNLPIFTTFTLFLILIFPRPLFQDHRF